MYYKLSIQLKKSENKLDTVAHSCSPSYSGGGDGEALGWRPLGAKGGPILISKAGHAGVYLSSQLCGKQK
jgi:hypothetical protein